MPTSLVKHALQEYRDVIKGDVESRTIVNTNAITALTVVPAKPFGAGFRRDIRFVNEGPQDIWIREFPATVLPNTKTGSVLLGGGDSVTFYDNGAIYMGEISAIAVAGNPNLHVTVL